MDFFIDISTDFDHHGFSDIKDYFDYHNDVEDYFDYHNDNEDDDDEEYTCTECRSSCSNNSTYPLCKDCNKYFGNYSNYCIYMKKHFDIDQ